jgi:colanic acid/amylovoran biosynthesis protein
MTKIVIAGASVYGLNNLSDDAMFAVFTRELHKFIPNLEITLLARHPSKELDEFFKVKSIKNLDHNSREESKGRFYNGLNGGDKLEHLGLIWSAIKDCDLFIVGGEPFIDISIGVYKGLIPYASLMITIAKFLNKPIMIKGIHIGRALTNKIGQEMTRYCIQNADLVTIREECTRPMLEELKINTNNVVTLSDTAYGLDEIVSNTEGQNILKTEGFIKKSKNLIGVTFRHMYWKWGKDVWEIYAQKVADVCDFIIDKFDADIVFIPHNTYEIDDKYMNDIPAHEDIYQKIKNQSNVTQIKNRYNIYQTLSIFPSLDLIFSNRRHSLIFGAIHGVAGLGVGEKLHVQVTMDELGIGGENFVDIDDFDIEQVKNNLIQIWKNRNEIISKEKRALPDLKKRALKHAEYAAKLINN